MGEYHENLTLEEALQIYETIPAERMNGIKGVDLNCMMEVIMTDRMILCDWEKLTGKVWR